MDTGTITGIIGTIVGIIALTLSILGFFYTRRKTKIMEEQLSIVRKEKEKKRSFEEVSKIIRKSISKIKESAKPRYFEFFLDTSRDDILAYMHDNQLEKLKLHIKPQGLKSIALDEKRLLNIKTIEDLIRTLKSKPEEKHIFFSFYFECKPDILQHSSIELVSPFWVIRNLYSTHETLKSYDYVIDAFDSTVLDDLEQTIDTILEVIFKSLMSEHEIIFRSIDKSEEILVRLEDEIVGWESVERLLRKLSDEICDRRLSDVQKEMFLRSS